MNKKYWLRLSLALFSLMALVLPWQTKLIVQPAAGNYWEIAIYAGSVLIWLSLLTLIPSGAVNIDIFKKQPFFWRWATVILLGVSFISAVLSENKFLAIYLWLLLFSAFVMFYFLISLEKKWKRRLLQIFLFSLAIQAVIGLVQFTTQTSFASTLLGMAYHNAGDLGATVIETANGRWLRAYGASGHPNVFGGMMAVGALGSLLFLTISEKRRERIYFVSIYLLFLAATLVSFSRAAILALLTGLVVFAFQYRSNFRSAPRRTVSVIILSLLVGGLIFFFYQPLFIARTQISNRLETISIDERQVYDYRGWQNFKQHPILGTGLGLSTWLDYSHSGSAAAKAAVWNFQPAHNYWLLAAAEGGIIFVACLAAIWAYAYQKSRQRRLLPIFAVLFILTLFDHWLFSLPLSSAFALFIFALMW